ncbi:hypothetical protein H0H92_002627 [Tricholoma furcatifolium]|nr:hypothetical protein H0H92_002627 [Tricholoma furcatifolium]
MIPESAIEKIHSAIRKDINFRGVLRLSSEFMVDPETADHDWKHFWEDLYNSASASLPPHKKLKSWETTLELDRGTKQAIYNAAVEANQVVPINWAPFFNSNADPTKEEAILQPWNADYIGTAAQALVAHVERYRKGARLTNGISYYYGNFASIIQSSGMGKSRLIKELGKDYFVINMNIGRGKESYPPPDRSVRDFLTKYSNTDNRRHLLYCFLNALFTRARDFVSEHSGLDYKDVSLAFRNMMQNDESTVVPSHKRQIFFDSVVHAARNTFQGTPATRNVPNALDDLISALGRTKPTKRTRGGKMTVVLPKPTVFLAFDECHTLMELRMSQDERDEYHSMYEVLRNLLSDIEGDLFTFFLSTTGKASQLTPPRHYDPSSRVSKQGLILIPPFTDLGFDQLMTDSKLSRASEIEHVSTLEFMAKFGRPMFGSRLKATGNVEELVLFAASKLLGAGSENGVKTHSQRLACISRRLPIDFYSSFTYADPHAEEDQVTSHLRVCLRVNDNLDGMTTVASSEPLLSEVAARLTADIPPHLLLRYVFNGFSVDKGNRGEFVCMLLLIAARDRVVYSRRIDPGEHVSNLERTDTGSEADNAANEEENVGSTEAESKEDDGFIFDHETGAPLPAISKGSALNTIPNDINLIFTLPAFLDALFSSANFSTHTPTQVHRSHTRKNFSEIFADTKMSFNHFVKVHAMDCIHHERLYPALLRNAAILCANSQKSIDGLVPFLWRPDSDSKYQIGGILFQSKNDRTYKRDHAPESRRLLFEAMDPFKLKVISNNDKIPVPIIRIVFALAAESPPPEFELVPEQGTSDSKKIPLYTSFDYWCPGVDSTVFKPVAKEDHTSWHSLVSASQKWEKLYTSSSSRLGANLRRSQNPLAGQQDAHFDSFFMNI